jgi:hypothetical protein
MTGTLNEIQTYLLQHPYLGVKGKVNPVLNYHHTIGTYGGVEVFFQSYLTSALDRGKLSASRPNRLIPWGRSLRD